MAIQGELRGRLGPYWLLDRIGEGGMGVVHLAADSQDRLVAIKVLQPQAASDENARRRLAREVETMRRVRSPFVAEVVDADVTGDAPYIVTRFVRGSTLEQVVARAGPLRGASLQRLASGLASALAAMHAAGIIHRDLKPRNIVMADGDPVVIDFGIAQLEGATPLTQTGVILGTPSYLAPEVLEGQSSQPSSDVHAWGATVAFAARGKPPYGTGSYDAIFCRIMRGKVSLDGIHGALYPLVAAALLQQPTQRPSAAWLANQVARLDLTVPVPSPMTAALATATPDVPAAATVNSSRMRGLPGEAAMPGDQPPTKQVPVYERPADVADLLPPVRYTPAGELRGPRPHRLLALAALAIGVGISLVLPVLGTGAVLMLLAALRALGRVQTSLAARRKAGGLRAIDALLVALSAPWALARSVLVTSLFAPLPLFIAGVAVVTAISAAGRSELPLAATCAAGGFTVLNCLGPGSRPPRRELHRVLNAIAPTRLAAATAALVLGVLAAAVLAIAILRASPFWPVSNLHSLPVHLPGGSVIRGSVLRLWHVGQGLARSLGL